MCPVRNIIWRELKHETFFTLIPQLRRFLTDLLSDGLLQGAEECFWKRWSSLCDIFILKILILPIIKTSRRNHLSSKWLISSIRLYNYHFIFGTICISKYGNDFTTLTCNTLSGPFFHLHSEKISLTQFCSLYVKSIKTGTDFKIKMAHSDSLCLVCPAGIL